MRGRTRRAAQVVCRRTFGPRGGARRGEVSRRTRPARRRGRPLPRRARRASPRAGPPGAASRPDRARRRPTPIPARRSSRTSRDMNSVSTNSPSDLPISSLRLGMMAVCGIGIPSGWRKSAVTANQSASAPTIAASANALTYPQPVLEPPMDRATTYSAAAANSKDNANTFILRSAAPRSRSSMVRQCSCLVCASKPDVAGSLVGHLPVTRSGPVAGAVVRCTQI